MSPPRPPLRRLWPVVAMVLLGGAIWLGLGGRQEAPAGQPAAPREPAPASAAVAPAAAGSAPAGVPSPPAMTPLRLPDGSSISPLNGVSKAGDFVWGEGPYAPIVGTTMHEGIEWWVHADGSKSTTVELWRPELGRRDGVTLVQRAAPLAPVDTGPGR